MSVTSIRLGLLAAMLGAALPTASPAQQPVSVSPDVTIDLGPGAVVRDQDVAVDDLLGTVVLEDLGPLQDRDAVVAFGRDVGGDLLMAFETTTELAGGVVARPGDVVRYDGATYSIEFDAAAAGLPPAVVVDATSISPAGLLLSFDTTVDLGGGLVAADEDLVVWDGALFTSVFDGSAAGVDVALDVDAAEDLGGGAFLMSFDSHGEVGGVFFADEDVLRFDGGMWSLEVDGSAQSAGWEAADLDAVPEPNRWVMLLAGLAGVFCLARNRHTAPMRP